MTLQQRQRILSGSIEEISKELDVIERNMDDMAITIKTLSKHLHATSQSRDDHARNFRHANVIIAELQGKIKRTNEESNHSDGSVDDFIHRLLGRLTELGHDVTDCDGEDEPAEIIARWMHCRMTPENPL